MTGYPHGRPGYIIDHIVPLACGGPDAPVNMNWQTVAEAKAKDKWEREDCHYWDRAKILESEGEYVGEPMPNPFRGIVDWSWVSQ